MANTSLVARVRTRLELGEIMTKNIATKGDKTLEKADTPSNTGTYVVRQWETRGDKIA